MRGDVAPPILPQGPAMLVADCNVPAGQLRITFPPPADWIAMVAGGFTVTVVIAGVDVQTPVTAVTLNKPEALMDAFAMVGF